jgi:hypothetical protein
VDRTYLLNAEHNIPVQYLKERSFSNGVLCAKMKAFGEK